MEAGDFVMEVASARSPPLSQWPRQTAARCLARPQLVGELIDDRECERRMQKHREDGTDEFYMLDVGGQSGAVIDLTYKGNEARFINHRCARGGAFGCSSFATSEGESAASGGCCSCDPNCEVQMWNIAGLKRFGIFALANLPEGTELTFDYGFNQTTGQFATEPITCRCGSSNCTGIIGGGQRPGSANASRRSTTKRRKASKGDTAPPKKRPAQLRTNQAKEGHRTGVSPASAPSHRPRRATGRNAQGSESPTSLLSTSRSLTCVPTPRPPTDHQSEPGALEARADRELACTCSTDGPCTGGCSAWADCFG